MDTVLQVMRFVRGEMRRQGAHLVSVPQFRALAFVHRHPRASLSDVADHLGVTPPTASALIDRLVRRRLLVRAGHPEERRRVILTLTRAGRRLFEQARATTRRRVAEVLAGVPADGLRKISEGLALLAQAFKEVSSSNGGSGGRRSGRP